MADCEIDRNSIQKNVYYSKSILLHNFYGVGWSVLLMEIQGSDKPGKPVKSGKNSVFCDTQGKPGKLRKF